MIQKQPDKSFINSRRVNWMILLFALCITPLAGQADTLQQEAPYSDTLIIENNSSIADLSNDTIMEHSPTKAMLFSLFLPGAGQVYNKKIWKVPIVYGVLAGAGYWVYYNTGIYREASAAYADDPSDFNERVLRAWRRNLELSYITLVAAHGLQILDAYVDAYLFYWDVNPDLAIRLEPSIDPIVLPTGIVAGNYGLKLSMKFK